MPLRVSDADENRLLSLFSEEGAAVWYRMRRLLGYQHTPHR